MQPVKEDLKMRKGATYTKTWIYADNTGVGISLADYEARMQIREHVSSATAEVSLTSSPAAGIVLEAGAEDGRIDIRIGADSTETFTFSTGVYDLEIYKPADSTEVLTLVEGVVHVYEGVTR
jgi:hypothetical protein